MFPGAAPVSPDVKDVSAITTLPWTSTVRSMTDSVEYLEFVALLQEADKLLEEQLNERSSQLDRQQKCVAHMTTRVIQLVREIETSRRGFRKNQSRLEAIPKTSKISKNNNRALSMLFETLSSFTESPDCLSAEECYHFLA